MRVGGRWLIAVSGIDRAEKKHAHEGIERLRAVIEQANEGMAVVDFETMQYVEINDACAHIYGRTRDEMMAMGPAQARASVGLPSSDLREIYQEVIRTSPRVHMYEGWFPRPDGTLFYMQTARQAVRIGEQWLIVLNTRDLTTEKLAQAELERSVQELRRSNKELEQFAYAASHDLSEPLRMIAGYTDLLHRRYGALLDDSGREFMGFILSGAQRMRQLIDDLLTYSRAGRGVREFRPVPLDALMRDVTDNLRRVIEDKGAAVEAGPLPEVMADRSLLTQLMQNLVSNATKFVEGRAPLVQVTCVREGEWWKVSVRDNGIGIAPKDFERIFVIFQRLNARDRYEGTGIGLALCKKIVETHRGQIWVESTPGEGSAFHFTLPVAPRIGPAPA
jgi:PAS domain S-box-containing protein